MHSDDQRSDTLADGKGGVLATGLVGLGMTCFGLGAWTAGSISFPHLNATDLIGAVAALASTAAAVASAYSAKFTRVGAQATRQSAAAGLASALATQETVHEMREARRDEQRPRLILERQFLAFDLRWPVDSSDNPLFQAVTKYTPREHSTPIFKLTNHSDAPASDVSIEYSLAGDEADFEISPHFQSLGIRVERVPTLPHEGNFRSLRFKNYTAGGVSRLIRHTEVTSLPFCGPHEHHLVEFPSALMSVLFSRGLQYRQRRDASLRNQEMRLTVKVTCYTVAKDRVERVFEYLALPFCYDLSLPLEVHSHFREAPVDPVFSKL